MMTKAEKRCLGNIIAFGGAHDTGMGKYFVGAIRKSVVHSLQAKGLVETGPKKPLSNGDLYTTWYATAKGCIAFGSEVAKLS